MPKENTMNDVERVKILVWRYSTSSSSSHWTREKTVLCTVILLGRTHPSCSWVLWRRTPYISEESMRVYRAEESIWSDSPVNDSSARLTRRRWRRWSRMIMADTVYASSCHQIDGTVAITKAIRTSIPFRLHYVWLITMATAAVGAAVLSSSSTFSHYCCSP